MQHKTLGKTQDVASKKTTSEQPVFVFHTEEIEANANITVFLCVLRLREHCERAHRKHTANVCCVVILPDWHTSGLQRSAQLVTLFGRHASVVLPNHDHHRRLDLNVSVTDSSNTVREATFSLKVGGEDILALTRRKGRALSLSSRDSKEPMSCQEGGVWGQGGSGGVVLHANSRHVHNVQGREHDRWALHYLQPRSA